MLQVVGLMFALPILLLYLSDLGLDGVSVQCNVSYEPARSVVMDCLYEVVTTCRHSSSLS
jgi:hypothetical protein